MLYDKFNNLYLRDKMNETEAKLYNRIIADLNKDKEYIKLNQKMQSFRPTDVRWFEAKTKLDNYISEKIESYYKLVNRDRVAFADLMAEMTPEEVQDCKFKSNMIIRLADMIEYYSLEIESILDNYIMDGKIMLFDKIRDAGKGAKEVIDYLGTTTGDFQMDIAETNDELRVKVESLVKMIRK